MTHLHLRTAIEQSPLPTAILGPDGSYLLVNAAWNALWSLSVGGPPEASNAFEDERLRAAGLIAYLSECRNGGVITASPLLLETRGEEIGPRWLEALVYPVRGEGGSLLEMGLVLEDFTERKALEDQLTHRAFHDPLTGLPNRALFSDRLAHALGRAKRQAEGESRAGSRCYTWTSTSLSASTTPWATRPATDSSSGWPSASRSGCAAATRSLASAETSSPYC